MPRLTPKLKTQANKLNHDFENRVSSHLETKTSLEKHNPAFMPFMLNNSVAKMICGSVKLYLDLNFYLQWNIAFSAYIAVGLSSTVTQLLK